MSHLQSSKKKARLSAETLIQQLNQLASQYNIKTWCLAYSGGVDSQVLLHLLHQTRLTISAIYIDHGLQAQSSDWAEHCKQQCQQLDIPFQIIKVDARPAPGESPEAAARSARYAALKTQIKAGCCLLTAQHQDDQAETILLQLLRGAGAAGLSGMPEIATFANGWHARPLLQVSQSAVLDYAQSHKLDWIEDPSNQQCQYDRNYLRHEVVPKIKQRWPAINKTLSVFSQQQAENARLLDVLAEQDLASARVESFCLAIKSLNELDNARLRNALRYWFKTIASPVPSRAVLAQIVQQIKNTSHDTAAQVSWAKCEVRRFRDQLYWLEQSQHDASQVLNWDVKSVLELPSINKKLSIKKINTTTSDIDFVLNPSVLKQSIMVRFRQGGEKIKPAGRNGSHDLKSLFQEASVPAWQRDKVPLIFADDELIVVVGYWLADDYAIKGEGLLPVINTDL
jgi:tRNA(Ile)-lysidine synthase